MYARIIYVLILFLEFTSCSKDETISNTSVEEKISTINNNLKWIDISNQKYRHVIIAEGTPTLYNGHPTTVMLDDNKTIFCTWSRNHAGPTAFLSVSYDAGLSWNRKQIPKDWEKTGNCPSIYYLEGQTGIKRLFIFSAYPQIAQTYSEDLGFSWSPVTSLKKSCIMAFSSIAKLKDGSYLGLYHNGLNGVDKPPLTIWGSISEDGGLTWSESRLVNQMEGRSPCEPYVFRSPDGEELGCIMRENQRIGNSLMMHSEDEGLTWSELEETSKYVTGDRHVVKYAPDGRLLIAFRDRMLDSPFYGHFVLWIGTYADVINKRPGQYRIKLLHNYAGWDCGYPGLEILPDNTVIATTYIKYDSGENLQSIVSVRFNLNELKGM